MWQQFDAGEIREDFARIAELGLDTVRVFLRWDDFAPERGRTDPAMLMLACSPWRPAPRLPGSPATADDGRTRPAEPP